MQFELPFPPPKRRRFVWPIVLVVIILGAVLLVSIEARGAPPENSSGRNALWYRSLYNPKTGVNCCSESDCRPRNARMLQGKFQVQDDDGTWYDVPDNAYLDRWDNPTGKIVACIAFGRVLCVAGIPGT